VATSEHGAAESPTFAVHITHEPHTPSRAALAPAPTMAEEPIDIASFTSESAMMIAFERALESDRDDGALFRDPFAKVLGTDRGEVLSRNFAAGAAAPFGFDGWLEFHKTWTVVRTKFIDDHINRLATAGCGLQLVNLGAGMDTRACRLDCYRNLSQAFEVDLEATIAPKAKVFEQIGATPFCVNVAVAADLLDSTALADGLASAGYNATAPSIFLAEGLIMYLGARSADFLAAVSAVAAPGSTLILNFIGSEDAAAPPGAFSEKGLREKLEQGGWTDLHFNIFGDEVLNYGRFNTAFPPSKSFSFVVCQKR